jgi:hypothetical protein
LTYLGQRAFNSERGRGDRFCPLSPDYLGSNLLFIMETLGLLAGTAEIVNFDAEITAVKPQNR